MGRGPNVLHGKRPEHEMAGCYLRMSGYISFLRYWEYDPVQLYRKCFKHNYEHSYLITGLVVAVIVAVVILGGIKRIAQVTEKLVPAMGALYVVLGIITIVMNIDKLPGAFAIIFQCAFNPQAAMGGVLGYTIMNAIRFGFARGVFSNEAGLGSAPIAHAAANTDNPVKQGMWGAFEVIFDTFIICTLTSLVVE